MPTLHPTPDPLDNLDPAQEQLADYLAGEMTPDQSRAFEARMETDPVLAHQAQSLKQTLIALDTGLQLRSAAPQRSVSAIARIGWAIIRYAAVAAVAFIIGASLSSQLRPIPPTLSSSTLVENATPQTPSPEQLAELNVDSGLAQTVLRIMQ